MSKDEIKALIRRRRAQMLVHSFLYYHQDNPIWSDDEWQQKADELTKLQADNPDCCKIKFYDKEFADWDGSTGMHLPKHVVIEQRANQVLRAAEAYVRQTDNFL